MKKIVSLLLILSVLIMSLLGCSADKAKLQTIELSEVTRSVFYAPQYVAISKGFFEEEGLEISITTAGGSEKAMTALLSGDADISLMGPETGIYVVNEGKEDHPIIIGQLTKRDGSFLVARTANETFTWESLKGSTIIGGRKGGMPLMTLQYILKEHGLEPGVDVEVLDNIQFNLMGSAFESGTGDYVTLFEPTATMFEKEGKGYIVANVGEASGEVPYTTYMVSQSTLAENPEWVEKFINAIYRAQQWILTASDTEIAEAIQPFFPDSTIEMLEYVAKSYRATDSWNQSPIMEEDDFSRLQDIIDSAGELNARVNFDQLVDNSIAEKIINK